jgi:hypothetical protein
VSEENPKPIAISIQDRQVGPRQVTLAKAFANTKIRCPDPHCLSQMEKISSLKKDSKEKLTAMKGDPKISRQRKNPCHLIFFNDLLPASRLLTKNVKVPIMS